MTITRGQVVQWAENSGFSKYSNALMSDGDDLISVWKLYDLITLARADLEAEIELHKVALNACSVVQTALEATIAEQQEQLDKLHRVAGTFNERFAIDEKTINDLEAELESLRKDAAAVAWGISVDGEMCDVFINKDACVLEFERRNKLYPETPRVMVSLAIAAAPKEK